MRPLFGADDAAGAGAVVDNDLLAQAFPGFMRDCPRDEIGRSARRIGHDETDRARGKRRGSTR